MKMTLRAQLNGVIISVLMMSFIGSVWINVFNTQHFLNSQLASHAQDTATSLGLSLSDPIFNEETIVVEATINAIFDRGFYHHITLESVDGEVLYKREITNQPEQVPHWFIELFSLNAPEQKTMIDTGWTIGGVLKVQSHTGIAHAQLWKSANNITHATLFIFILALLFAYILLQKIYRPIKAISHQAEAVQKRQFIMIEKLPSTVELRSFVIAMNKMVANIKNTFDELTQDAAETHRVAYIDEQTGLANRRSFINVMDALLAESAKHRGYVMMARINGLAELNKNQGYQAGDNLVRQLINEINESAKVNNEVKLFRVSGSEFCLFIDNYQEKRILELLTALLDRINLNIESNEDSSLAFGFVNFSSGENFADIMYKLDMATNNAVESSEGYYIQNSQQHKADLEKRGTATNLKAVLDIILSNPDEHIILKSQAVRHLNERPAFDAELFACFEYQNETINTGDLFAIASQYQLAGQLDLTILNRFQNWYQSGKFAKKTVSLNLSRLTFNDADKMSEVTELIKESGLGESLVIGITESSILGNLERSSQIIETLREQGCAICINRFGTSMESLQYLMEIRPSQVKLSPAYTRNIDQKESNAQMVSAFTRMAHGLDITVLAQCIETEQELEKLKALNVDAALGYVICRPTVIG